MTNPYREALRHLVDQVTQNGDTDTMASQPYAEAEEVLRDGTMIQRRIDDRAVDTLAATMKAELGRKRANGYGGWQDQACTQQHLSNLFHKQVAKGNTVGAANYLAFLHSRGQSILPHSETP